MATTPQIGKTAGIKATDAVLVNTRDSWAASDYADLLPASPTEGITGTRNEVQNYIFANAPDAQTRQTALLAANTYDKIQLQNLLCATIEAALATKDTADDDSRIRRCFEMADAAGIRDSVLANVQGEIDQSNNTLKSALQKVFDQEHQAAIPSIFDTHNNSIIAGTSANVAPMLQYFMTLCTKNPVPDEDVAHFNAIVQALTPKEHLELGIKIGQYHAELLRRSKDTFLDAQTAADASAQAANVNRVVQQAPDANNLLHVGFALNDPQATVDCWRQSTPEGKKNIADNLKAADLFSGCDLNERTQALMQPDEKAKLLELQRANSNNWCIDGAPYMGINQKGYGNCWAISALVSLGQTQWGREKIDECFSADVDGGYAVRFPGDPTHTTYHISAAEANDPKLMTFDGGDAAASLGFRVVLAALQKISPDGADSYNMYKLLCSDAEDSNVKQANTADDKHTMLQNLVQGHTTGRITGFVASFGSRSTGTSKNLTAQTAGEVGHSFIITAIDYNSADWGNSQIEYRNPADPTQVMSMSFEDFEKQNPQADYIDPSVTGDTVVSSDPAPVFYTPPAPADEQSTNELSEGDWGDGAVF